MTRPRPADELPPLQPLRIPPGWRVNFNTLFEIDATPEAVADGYFGGSVLFSATIVHLRIEIEVEWRPEDDPAGGYHMTVLEAPRKQSAKGRRRGRELDYAGANEIHSFTTRSRRDLVAELERWLERSPSAGSKNS